MGRPEIGTESVVDSERQIFECLHCKRPECNNCIARKGLSYSQNRIYAAAEKAWKDGLSVSETAKLLGKQEVTVARYWRDAGLAI